jgi:hypothetical protein
MPRTTKKYKKEAYTVAEYEIVSANIMNTIEEILKLRRILVDLEALKLKIGKELKSK